MNSDNYKHIGSITDATASEPIWKQNNELSRSFQNVSLAQRLDEAERFILSLESMLTKSVNRERELHINLEAIKSMNLALRVDALNYEIEITALEDAKKALPGDQFSQVASNNATVSHQPHRKQQKPRIGIFALLTSRR